MLYFYSNEITSRVALCASVVAICFASQAPADEIEFNRDVRPILSDKCFACHGPDEKTRAAELRLDQQASAFAGRDGQRAVVPGEVGKSSLIARITSSDELERMPPPEAGPPLSTAEISILKEWIKQGANYQAHWSYLPVERPKVPNIEGEQLSPIDNFIVRKQKQSSVAMNSQADRRTLIRRLYFDVTGLPPTPDEVEAFQADQTNNAYEKIVDRLLQSPHYGERMAMYWLDLVRYADTLGYHGDQVRSVSPYRDYVIEAFNNNMPFDQFTWEQLAGDLLPAATLSQKVASTYNRLNRASAEGGLQPKEYLAKYSADRVRTAGSVWLGSTIGCAECHDHKFDPFSTKDFYSFGAFFADIKEQGIVSGAKYIEQLPVPTEDQSVQLEKLTAQIAQAESEFKRTSPELKSAFEAWQEAAKLAADRWRDLIPVQATSQNGSTLTIAEDGVITASGKNPDKETYTIQLTTDLASIGAIKLAVLADDSLPAKGPGRAGNGNFVVNKVNVDVAGKKLKWAKSYGSHAQGGFPPENLAKNEKGWAILPKTGEDHYLVLEAKSNVEFGETEKTNQPEKVTIQIIQKHGSGHAVGRFKLSASANSASAEGSLVPTEEVAKLLSIAVEKRTEAQHDALLDAFRTQTPLLKEPREHLANLRKQKKQIDAAVLTTLVTVSTTPREMRVLPRGDWMSTAGEVVLPAYPEFLVNSQESAGNRLTRLDLANWLTSPENPLVARTFVNRLWMLYFGYGICRSVDDLGSQGEWPTHPELLDWLAAEFVESGWDIKHLTKLMVMSQCYQQSSMTSPEISVQDPYNELFARQTKQRLDAEMIRDNALLISGLLVNEIGGASAKPYQPAGYWAQLNFPKRTYQADQSESQYRRGLYTHWQRTFLHPSLLAFDAPAREECTARRERSNTPLQALVLLNDPTYVEASRVFAANVVKNAKTFNERLNYAYRKCLNRQPTPQETTTLRELYQSEIKIITQAPTEHPFLKTGLAPAPATGIQSEVAAWTSITRVLLNLHETITKY